MTSSKNEQPTDVSRDDCVFGATVVWQLLSAQPLSQEDGERFVALFGETAEQMLTLDSTKDVPKLVACITRLTKRNALFNKYYVACLFNATVFPQATATPEERVTQLHELVAAIDESTGGPEEWLRVMLREPTLPGMPQAVFHMTKKNLGRNT